MLDFILGSVAFTTIFLEKEHYGIMIQSLTHKSTNCWSQNSPKMTVCGVPIYCEYMFPAKTQKIKLNTFATFKITNIWFFGEKTEACSWMK